MSAVDRWTEERFAAHQAKRAAACAVSDSVAEVIEYGTPIAHVRPRQFLLTLPYPPTLNHNTMPTLGGGRYLTQEHKNFRALVAQIVFASGIKRLDGRLSVTITASAPDARARDLDNIVKPTLDALQRAGAILDDCNVDELIVRRVAVRTRGTAQVVVIVREMT